VEQAVDQVSVDFAVVVVDQALDQVEESMSADGEKVVVVVVVVEHDQDRDSSSRTGHEVEYQTVGLEQSISGKIPGKAAR
jgi:hypothetical protein